MLSTTLSTDERITTAHRAKLAYVYVRQSSPGQVRHHQESTELQYRLVERAALFGWPRERVHVIDEDLGKSGASSRDRHGFQTLIAEVGLGKAPDSPAAAIRRRWWSLLHPPGLALQSSEPSLQARRTTPPRLPLRAGRCPAPVVRPEPMTPRRLRAAFGFKISGFGTRPK